MQSEYAHSACGGLDYNAVFKLTNQIAALRLSSILQVSIQLSLYLRLAGQTIWRGALCTARGARNANTSFCRSSSLAT